MKQPEAILLRNKLKDLQCFDEKDVKELLSYESKIEALIVYVNTKKIKFNKYGRRLD